MGLWLSTRKEIKATCLTLCLLRKYIPDRVRLHTRKIEDITLVEEKPCRTFLCEIAVGKGMLTISKQTEATKENMDLYHGIELKLPYDKTHLLSRGQNV